MEAIESYGRQQVRAPSVAHSLCLRGRISPPVTGGRPKLSKRQHHVGSVCSVNLTAVSFQTIICRATNESPDKISLSARQPAQSAILICERRAVSKNFINFCCALDSNRYQHLQYLAKGRNKRPATRVTGGRFAPAHHPVIVPISLAKTQTDSDGVVGMCFFSSPQFLGTQGRRVYVPCLFPRALG